MPLNRTYAGQTLTVPDYFGEDQIGDETVRAWAHRQYATVTGNTFSNQLRAASAAYTKAHPKVKEPTFEQALSMTDHAGAQSWYDTIALSFDHTKERGEGTGQANDPVTRQALAFAKTDVEAVLLSKFGKGGAAPFRAIVEEDGRTRFTHMVEQRYLSKKDAYLERAKAAVAEAAARAEQEDDLGFDVSLPTEPEAEAA